MGSKHGLDGHSVKTNIRRDIMKRNCSLLNLRIVWVILCGLFFAEAIFAQSDINVKISQTSLTEVINTLIESRSVNFGDYTGTWITDGWFVNLDGATISIGANNAVSITANIVATAENVFDFINNATVHANVRIDGNVQLQSAGDGYKILFVPTNATVLQITAGSWTYFNNLFTTMVNGTVQLFAYRMGPIELNSGTKLLPAAITSYFTSTTPVLTTLVTSTDNYIVLSYTIAGNRKIMIQNYVGGHSDVGNVQVLESSNWNSYTSPKTEWWALNSAQSFRLASPAINYSNQWWRFQSWTGGILSSEDDITVSKDMTYSATYLQAQPVTIQISLEGTNTNVANSLTFYGQNVSSTYSDYGFMPPNSTSIGVTQSSFPLNNFTWNWLNWENGSTATTRTISPTAPTTYSANYKAHLGTNRPDLGDAKNQRRFLKYGNSFFTVYESLGNIWLTSSFDGGNTWFQEEQLNVNPGNAKNPTFSNLWSYNGNYYGIISWTEINTSGTSEIHLQTFTVPLGAPYPHPVNYGWDYRQGGNRSSTNHRTILQMGDALTPTSNARPVIQINDVGGGTAYIIYAKETNGSGISWSWFNINESQNQDLSTATFDPAGGSTISTNTLDNCPVITYYPSSYGYPARTDLYYLGGGYSGYTLRVVRYSLDNYSTQVLPNGYQEYTYASLQGVTNPQFATIGLVADGVASSGRVAVYYTKPTYSTSSPTVSTIYLNLMQPAIQAQNVSSFGNPVVDISMKSTSAYTWYTASNGSSTLTSVGNNVAGVFSQLLAPSGDKTAILLRNSVSPALIQKSSSSGQTLNKSSDIQTNTRCVFMKGSATTQEVVGILDFSGANITVLDTVQTGNQISVRIQIPTTSIVKQLDSLRVAVGIELKRGGNAILAYLPSLWSNISAQSIAGIQSGDILTFSLGIPKDSVWWYKEVSIAQEALNKNEALSGDVLIPTTKDISVYPNPFNPTTTFQVSLPQAGRARLVVYNTLGQKVAVVLDSFLQAGYTNVRFDGSHFASGIYIYRLEMGDFIKSGKMLLMK